MKAGSDRDTATANEKVRRDGQAGGDSGWVARVPARREAGWRALAGLCGSLGRWVAGEWSSEGVGSGPSCPAYALLALLAIAARHALPRVVCRTFV